ncbi:MAG: hypothetical protein PHO64_07980 [Thiomonas sp.]|nr:hypothetical protein [Thiomonas sp.]
MSELRLADVLCKTSAGRREQQQRSHALGAKQRHVLILCDGRRTLGELCALMGDSVFACAQELLASGHVERIRMQDAHTSEAPALIPSAVPATQLAQAVAPPARRSIALSRMYMFDMIERLLGHHSGPARAHLRAADQPDALLLALQDCLPLIAEVAGSAQADKVRAQLCTMLPEDWVVHFERPHTQRTGAEIA